MSLKKRLEEEVEELAKIQKWPCYFLIVTLLEKKNLKSFIPSRRLDMQRFDGIGIIKNEPTFIYFA